MVDSAVAVAEIFPGVMPVLKEPDLIKPINYTPISKQFLAKHGAMIAGAVVPYAVSHLINPEVGANLATGFAAMSWALATWDRGGIISKIMEIKGKTESESDGVKNFTRISDGILFAGIGSAIVKGVAVLSNNDINLVTVAGVSDDLSPLTYSLFAPYAHKATSLLSKPIAGIKEMLPRIKLKLPNLNKS